MNRNCNNCTACCEGWLDGNIYGYEMYPGKSCHFMGVGECKIYDQRPERPCKSFKCAWLNDQNGVIFPDWLYPKSSKIIITERTWGENDDKIYLDIVECGQKIDSEILVWLIHLHFSRQIPMTIMVNGKNNYFGPPEFCSNINKIIGR
jgi:hypothetical protein